MKNGLKITFLSLTIFFLLVGGAVWFDYLEIIRLKWLYTPVVALFKESSAPLKRKFVGDPQPPLAQLRGQKQQEALLLQQERLDRKEKDLETQIQEFKSRQEELNEREKQLKEREKALNAAAKLYENKEERLRQSARYLMTMPPEKAMEVLVSMDDLDVIELLRTAEILAGEDNSISLVSYWLSLMPPKRAGELQRKMMITPGDH